MNISEQVKELRDCVNRWQNFENVSSSEPFKLLSEAADTIESLSAKLKMANVNRSAEDCGGWISCSERMPEEDKDVLIRYYNSKEGKFLTDIAWIGEDGNWQLTREEAGYFPPNFKKEITKWMPLPKD